MLIHGTTLAQLVREELVALIDAHGFCVVELDPEQVVLSCRESKVLIWVYLEREGVDMQYLVEDGPDMLAYSLGLYLVTKRPRVCVETDAAEQEPYLAECRSGLRSYGRALTTVAMDILSGDRKWLSEFDHRPLRLSPTWVRQLRLVLGRIWGQRTNLGSELH